MSAGADEDRREGLPLGHLVVPVESLSPEALRGVIEAFVLREGTDYGLRELTLEQKVGEVRGGLERGEAQIVYDPGRGSVTVIATRDLSR